MLNKDYTYITSTVAIRKIASAHNMVWKHLSVVVISTNVGIIRDSRRNAFDFCCCCYCRCRWCRCVFRLSHSWYDTKTIEKIIIWNWNIIQWKQSRSLPPTAEKMICLLLPGNCKLVKRNTTGAFEETFRISLDPCKFGLI